MNNQFYQHDEFNAWLSPRVNEETYQLLTQTIQLLVEHMNTTDVIAGQLSLFLSDSEGKDDYDQLFYIREQLMHYSIKALREYGVFPDTDQLSLNDQPYLNQCLSGLLLILDYEDPMAIQSLLELGNPSIEVLGEVLHLVEPELEVEAFMQKTTEVFSSTLERIGELIAPALREQEASMAETNTLVAKETRQRLFALKDALQSTVSIAPSMQSLKFIITTLTDAISLTEPPSVVDFAGRLIEQINNGQLSDFKVYPHIKPTVYAIVTALCISAFDQPESEKVPGLLSEKYSGKWFDGQLSSTMKYTSSVRHFRTQFDTIRG